MTYFLVTFVSLLALSVVNAGTTMKRTKTSAVAAKNNNATVTSTNCNGNCPYGCGECPCGTEPNKVNVVDWCAKFSGWNQEHCQCIANAESSANANAVHVNSDNGSYDVGLWQINDFNWESCSGGVAPCDVAANLECAKMVYEWGDNTWKFWVTCEVCGVCDKN